MNIILSGCNGRMGKTISLMCEKNQDIKIIAGIDINNSEAAYKVYANINEAGSVKADALLDFSHPSALPGLLDFCKAKNLPIVLCATGYSPEDEETIRIASQYFPVFKSGNMSLGINLLYDLVQRAALVLNNYDIEITEKHHNKKLDAPSGTANMLLEAVCSVKNDIYPVYDRHSVRRARDPNEIGIHSLRGGNIIGEHEVMFAGTNEIIQLTHTASSRDVFASGAIRALEYIVKVKANGMYDMHDLIDSL